MLKNLKSLRESKNISQQKLGEIIGVSQQSINKYENHNIEPDIKTLMLIADYFQTSIDYVVGYTDSNTSKCSGINFTADEYEHLKKYRLLSQKQKTSIDLIIDNYLA